jgi:hypothetical protein
MSIYFYKAMHNIIPVRNADSLTAICEPIV